MITRTLIMCFLFTSFMATAQEGPTPLTTEEKKEVIDSISTILDRSYVFPDIGAKIGQHLQDKLAKGAYNELTDPMGFAGVLTEDVRSVNNDLHLRVRFDPQGIAERRNTVTPEDSLAFLQRQRRMGQKNNHGFKEVKVLDGNIGYLNLSGFFDVDEFSGATASAAMNFLSNTDALIIDLRDERRRQPLHDPVNFKLFI
jgi:hypothetical protein